MREMSVLNEHYAARSAEFYKRYYSQLEGAKIVKFKGMVEDEYSEHSDFPQFSVRLANGQLIKIEISQDEEGNGGGFIFGMNYPDMSDWTVKTAVIMAELEKENA
jgi:hypothetical protein